MQELLLRIYLRLSYGLYLGVFLSLCVIFIMDGTYDIIYDSVWQYWLV